MRGLSPVITHLFEPINALAGLLVGLLVGITGVGGGSLMAPILILIVGVAPTTAVGTDLWFAAATKTVGGAVHHRFGQPDWQIVRRLLIGSIPGAILTIFVLSTLHGSQLRNGLIVNALGILLILTAIATLSRRSVARRVLKLKGAMADSLKHWQVPLTVLAGAVLGALVTLTSVGAGALGATILLGLYPARMTMKKLVGTDIIHAVPLTLVAGMGYLWLGEVDFMLLASLLVGSIPGIVIGSLLASKLSENIVQPALALVLVAVATKMLTS